MITTNLLTRILRRNNGSHRQKTTLTCSLSVFSYRQLGWLLVFTTLVGLHTPAIAKPEKIEPILLKEALLEPASSAAENEGKVSLKGVLKQVETYHPLLRGAELDRRIARARNLERKGAFDPIAFANTEYLRYNNPSKRGSEADSLENSFGFTLPTRLGMDITTGSRFNYGKIKSPDSASGTGGEYFVEVKAPLLRGAGINERFAAEKQARIGIPLADAAFAERRLDILRNAAVSYWDWAGSKLKLDIAQQLLSLAEIRAKQVEAQASLGDIPAIDSLEAQQEAQMRQGGIENATRSVQKACLQLSLFLWEPSGTPSVLLDISQAPSTLPEPKWTSPEETLEARQKALDARPELKGIQWRREMTEIDLALAKNQLLPKLDVIVSPGVDTGNRSIDGPTVKAGIYMSVPLLARTARGKVKIAKLSLEKLSLEQLALAQRVITQVDDAISAMNQSLKRYEAAQKELSLARRVEQGERERYTLGDSTLFVVNRRERATAEAANKLIDIQIEYQQAFATFLAVTGQF
ncbi:MAG: TolC family protein [Cyanobacteria bacterium]|nr:TolC family protein [Cyanobacteriota bacterium]